MDRFRVRELLGEGTSGKVYRAVDEQLGREVALKVVTLTGEKALARFQREGEVTARLHHAGIVRVHAAGRWEGQGYLAYELIEQAETLDEAFARLPLEKRVTLVLEAAQAVAHAHAAGVVHRDLKADNVLVDPTGHARVADFGLAAGADMSRLTASGAYLGTPVTMAPEQFAGGPIEPSPEIDTWALGVLLYQALTRELPFRGSSFWELAAQVTNGEPRPPRELNREVSAPLEAVCLKALEKAPGTRYADARDFSAALQEALTARPSSPWSLLVGAAILLVLATAAVAASALSGGGGPADPSPAPTASSTPTGPEPEPARVKEGIRGWDLESGERQRSRFVLMFRSENQTNGNVEQAEMRYDLREQVRDVRRGLATVEATFDWLRLELKGEPAILHDSRPRMGFPFAPFNRLIGETFTYRFYPATGQVRHVLQLQTLRDEMLESSHNVVQEVAGRATDRLTDEAIGQAMELVMHVLPAEVKVQVKLGLVEGTMVVRQDHADDGTFTRALVGWEDLVRPIPPGVNPELSGGGAFRHGRLAWSELRITAPVERNGMQLTETWLWKCGNPAAPEMRGEKP